MSQPFEPKVDQSLKNALSSMRVPELKNLLRDLGERVSGKKDDLLERAFEHFVKLAQQLKDGKISRQLALNQFALVKGTPYYSPPPTETISSHLKRPPPQPTFDDESPVKKLRSHTPIPEETDPKIIFANPQHIKLELTDDPFFEVVTSERPLVQFLFKSVPNETSKNFEVSIDKFGLIRQQRWRVVVRCFLCPEASYATPPKHLWPQNFSLRVNGHWQDIITKNDKKKTLPKCSDVTPFLQKGRNEIFVMYQGNSTYYLTAQLFKKVGVEDLILTVPKCPFTDAKKRVLEIFNRNSVDGVEATSSQVSVMDPLVRCRIKIASRSIQCKHVQCFDLSNYLKSNERGQSSTWLCPVCSNPAPFSTLTIDGFVSSILEETPDGEEVITVSPDGTWEIPKRQVHTIVAEREVVDLLDSDEDDEDGDVKMTPPPSTTPRPLLSSSNSLSQSTNQVICIDLDDD